jgi:hypothetical protein
VHAIEVTCKMVVGARVHVPVGVDAGLDSVARALTTFKALATVTGVLRLVRMIEALAAAESIMPVLGADLALGAIAALLLARPPLRPPPRPPPWPPRPPPE